MGNKAKLKLNEVEVWQVQTSDEPYVLDLPQWVKNNSSWFNEGEYDANGNYWAIDFHKYHIDLHISSSWGLSSVVQVGKGDYLVKGCGGYIIPVAKQDYAKYFEEVPEDADR